MNGRARQMRQWAVGIFCALALLLSGVAHHPVAQVFPADLADYILPDGTIPDLCLSDDRAGDDSTGGGQHHRHACGPCCLSIAATLPLPTTNFVQSRVDRPSGFIQPAYASILRPVLDTGLGARAPPYGKHLA